MANHPKWYGNTWHSPIIQFVHRSHLTPYSGPGSTLEGSLVSQRHGRAIDLWPGGPLATATYELPQIGGGQGEWVRQQLAVRFALYGMATNLPLRPEYQASAAATMARVLEMAKDSRTVGADRDTMAYRF